MPDTARFVSLADLKAKRVALAQSSATGCGSSAGAGKSGCGSAAGPDALSADVWDRVKDHPCYSEDAHHHFARMHVAVAPACNIQCHYCNRKYDCSNESRPGVVSRKLTPQEAADKVIAVARKIPQLSVVGIAGPGDALANPAKTFETFRLLREAAPDIRLCLSTNGLALPDYVDEIAAAGVDHVTITLNAIDPEIGARIYPWIFYNHDRITGVDAARILLARQMEGLERLVARGVLVKINSVLIPGVNDQHLVEVNRAVKARGAFLHNIMPLISDPAHGTHYGLTGQRGPTAQELKAVQDACSDGANLMRHCRQCRADAVGMLGEDRSGDFNEFEAVVAQPEQDMAARRQYRETVEATRAAQRASKAAQAALNDTPAADVLPPVLIGVATKGEGRVNQHFGHAGEFQIYEVTDTAVRFIGHRRVEHYCQGGYGEDDTLPATLAALNDCHAVLVAKIGGCPRAELRAAGIEPVEAYAHRFIEEAALAWRADFRGRVQRGETEYRARPDATLRPDARAASA